MKRLIVEDEPKTAAYLKKELAESGFPVLVAADGETLEGADHLFHHPCGMKGPDRLMPFEFHVLEEASIIL